MAQVAALVAGWQRRLGGQAGPLGPVSAGSGDSPNGEPLQVELFVGGTWEDITSYVMTRDGSGNVGITRGQPNQGTQTDPGRCTLQLNNRDARFSQRNPLSPYYGKLGRNQPIRVSVPAGNSKSYRFWGEVANWPEGWDTTGGDQWVDLEASGILRRLGNGATPVGSTLYLALASVVAEGRVLAYWPCEDASGATSIASALIGGTPMTISGTPSLAASSSFACSGNLPTMGSGSFTGVVPTYTAPSSVEVDFLLAVPSGGATDGQIICRFTTSGTISTWEVYYSAASGGYLGLRGITAAGIVQDTGAAVGPMNGLLLQVSATLATVGSGFTYNLTYLEVGSSVVVSSGGSAASNTVGLVRTVTIAPDRGLSDTTVGHVWVQVTDPSLFSEAEALTAYAGETAGARIERACAIGGISLDSIGDLDSTEPVGAQPNATVLSIIDEAAAADIGMLYERTDAIGLGYRTSTSLQNQTSALTLSYSAFNLSEVPRPVNDDEFTHNDVKASRSGGSSARTALESGTMSVADPPAGAGRYNLDVTVNVASDSALPDQAGWRLHLGTVDEARFPQISVNLAHPSFVSNPTLRNQVLAVRQGDRITVTGVPSQPDSVEQIVLGFSEKIDGFQHRITFNCAPESPYRVAVLDDSVLSRLDGDSTLGQDVGAADTSLLVVTPSDGALWTTSDTPFDIRVGGERMTVTAVSGAASPQTFTVTRSVNGVTKPQAAGTAVTLNQPAVVAL